MTADAPHPATFPGLGRRLAAMVYETLILFAVIIGGFFLPHVLLGMLAGVSASGRLLLVHLVFLLMVYYGWFWTHGGQTAALKTWRMKIVDCSGAPLRPMQAMFRYLLAWPSLLCCGVGIVWALFDREGQFLHDRIADTRIVFAPENALQDAQAKSRQGTHADVAQKGTRHFGENRDQIEP